MYNKPGECYAYMLLIGCFKFYLELQNKDPHFVFRTCLFVRDFFDRGLICQPSAIQTRKPAKGIVLNLEMKVVYGIKNWRRIFA